MIYAMVLDKPVAHTSFGDEHVVLFEPNPAAKAQAGSEGPAINATGSDIGPGDIVTVEYISRPSSGLWYIKSLRIRSDKS